MAVRLIKKFLPLLLLFVPLFAHASTIGIPPNNLSLADYWPLNEGSGTTAHDTQGNNGTLSGSTLPTWVAGKFGQALNFNGTTAYVDMGNIASADLGTGGFTVCLWEKPGNLTGSNREINLISKINNFTDPGWVLELGTFGGSATTYQFSVYMSGAHADSSYFTIGTWVYACFTRSGSTVSIYTNGQFNVSATNASFSSSQSNAQSVQIAKQQVWQQNYFPGTIDEVRIYNRALSATEIASLYNTQHALMSASYSPGSLASGLVGWWPFDGKTITTNVQDIAGGNNGFMQSFTSTSSAETIGKIGQALNFNGTNSYVKTTAPSVGSGSPFTWAAWVNISPGSGSFPMILDDANQTQHILFGINVGSVNGGYTLYVNGVQAVSSAKVASSTWTHVVGIYDGSHSYIYINGALSATSPTTGTSPGFSGVFIGNGTELGNSFWKGGIDDVRVYNRALSASEVTQLYNVGQGAHLNASSASTTLGSSLQSGLVGLWTFDGKDMAQNATDESGQGNNGYLVNYTSTTSSETIGKIGQALNFNSSAPNFIKIPHAAAIDNISTATAAAWVKTTASGQLMVFSAWGGANTGYQLFVDNGKAALWGPNIPANLDGTTTITDGKWHHIASVWNGTTAYIYVDGYLQNSAANTLVNSTLDNQIGTQCSSANSTGCNLNYSGTIDDVRVYNRALSAAEIKQLYNLGH